MSLSQPLINGYRYDYSAVELAFNGAPIAGRAIRAISYKDGVSRGIVRGSARMRLGKTPGDYNAEASIEVPKLELDVILKVLTNSGARGIYDVPFELSVSYAATGAPLQVDNLVGCQIDDIDDSHSQGTEGLISKVTLNVHAIIRNGVKPLDATSMLL